MPQRITIQAGGVRAAAELNDGPTARALGEQLPLQARAQRWGEEIYFTVPVQMPLEPGAREEMEVGELGYWPSGPAFCIFFGPTPASDGPKPKAASAVTILGRVLGDATAFRAVKSGAAVTLERA